MIYTIDSLLLKYKDYSNPYNKIVRETKVGNLIKLMRGLYIDKKVSNYLLSGYIYGPSYISFEYVLSNAGLTPEYVPNITCATFKKNKSKIYDTPVGIFIYRDIPEDAFIYGVTSKIENNYSYLIATPEKALCDELFIKPQVHSMKEFKELLYEDLRIDKKLFSQLDLKLMKKLAILYKKSNLKFLISYVEQELENE